MIKSIIVLVVSALLVSVALAEEKTEDQCVEESANILSTLSVSEDVKDCLDISHDFYSNLKEKIEASEPSEDYIEALKNATYPDGCNQIREDFTQLPLCFDDLLEQDHRKMLKIVGYKPKTEEVLEAYYLCDTLMDIMESIEEQKLRQKCVEKSADSLSKVHVDESVMKLLNVSRDFYSNLEEIIKTPEPSLEYMDAMRNAAYADGCREINEGFRNLDPCFDDLRGHDLSYMLDIVDHRPETEKIFEALYACDRAKFVQISRVFDGQ